MMKSHAAQRANDRLGPGAIAEVCAARDAGQIKRIAGSHIAGQWIGFLRLRSGVAAFPVVAANGWIKTVKTDGMGTLTDRGYLVLNAEEWE